MKKQFFRVKQLADQTFSRAGKTEALSDDLQAADKKIEFIKVACGNISKRLSTSLLAVGQDAQAKDKRLKKCPEYLLALVLLESSNGDEDDLLRHILLECSKIQMCLANTFADYDARIESNIVTPLNQIVEVDVPNVLKQKRYLTKLILDMDSARNRYQAALKHNSSTGGSAANTAKVDSIKDELEDVEMKVEQCRDALASEMFQIISRESEIAALLLGYIKHQQTCHKTALTLLNEMVPEIEAYISNSSIRRVFGLPLQEHLRITQRKIAYPVELCVCTLLELGMEEEGLFRVAGGASKVRRMKLSFDANCITWETALEYRDIHVIASVLKSYLRELPDPLLTHKLYYEWMSSIRNHNSEQDRLSAIGNAVKKLPEGNLDNLRYMIKFLSALTKNQDVNKMTSQNLAIVIAPNLIWSPDKDFDNIGHNMNVASQHTAIVEYLLTYADYFFPGDEPFYVTLEITKKTHTRSNSADISSSVILPNISDSNTPVRRTQSSDSLVEEQPTVTNAMIQGSPKPVTRTRKSKPAPVPPVSTGSTVTANVPVNRINNSPTTKVDDNGAGKTVELSPSDETYATRKTIVQKDDDEDASDNKCVIVTCVRYDLNEAVVRKPVVSASCIIDTACTVVNSNSSSSSSSSTATNTTTTTTTTSVKSVDDSGQNKLRDDRNDNNDRRTNEEDAKLSFNDFTDVVDDDGSSKSEFVPGKKLLSTKSPRSCRTTLCSSSADIVPYNQEEIILRKPIIPERPASLQRPFSSSSFRKLPDFIDVASGGSNNNNNSNNTYSSDQKRENNLKISGGPSLERTHLYSVDKQQVSIIQVKASPEEVPIDAESAESLSTVDSAAAVKSSSDLHVAQKNEDKTTNTDVSRDAFSTDVVIINNINGKTTDQTVGINCPVSVNNVTSHLLPPISTVNNNNNNNNKIRPVSGYFSDKKELSKERPERPPKPESICDRSRNNNSSHMRAFSDGHNIDIYGSLPSPHRTHQRVQRPLPPPPPPPSALIGKHRHNSMVDSTNL